MLLKAGKITVPLFRDRDGKPTDLQSGDCLVWEINRFKVVRWRCSAHAHELASYAGEWWENLCLHGLKEPMNAVFLILAGRGLDCVCEIESKDRYVFTLVEKEE